MDKLNLDNEIKLNFIKIDSHKINLKYIHFKSISNFKDDLLNIDSKKMTSQAAEIGVYKKKIILLEYLQAINSDNNLSEEKSKEYFRKYVYPIGLFMSTYFGYVYIDYSALILKYLIVVVLFLIIDFLIFIFTSHFYFVFIFAIVLYSIRLLIKFKQNKIYGSNW